MAKHKAYKYRQGKGWIVAKWDSKVQCYRLSHELGYWLACAAVRDANKRGRA